MRFRWFFFILSWVPLWSQEDDRLEKIKDLSLEELMHVTVVSASRHEESLLETVVPVSVITETQIVHSQALTLKELLLKYVPGLTHVEDQNEVNIAMRGVYTSSQQKILFMVDGLRLNSRSYSMATPDFSIPLHHIQRIEILRGPASSLYGNVALTAVVNIILKKGSEVEGAVFSVAAGAHEQKRARLLAGGTTERMDWMIWTQFYESEGEQVWIDPEDDYSETPSGEPQPAILGGFTDRPTLSTGAKLSGEFGQLLFTYQESHYIEPFSGGGITGEAYAYDDYEKYEGIGPGLLTSGWLAEYKNIWRLWSDFELFSSVYTGENRIHAGLVIDPAAGVFGQPYWREKIYGSTVHGTYTYEQGTFIAGVQADGFSVGQSSFPFGVGGVLTTDLNTPEKPLIYNGSEYTLSGFLQVKHRFSSNFIANIGVRTDHKKRKNDDPMNEWSPRVGLVWMINDQYNLKVSYSTSFVDAPYWYRFNTLNTFRGAESLKPEFLKSFQVSPQFFSSNHNLKLGLNLFYNRLDDFIFRDNMAPITEANYSNAGRLTSWGLEPELMWNVMGCSLTAIATYQKAINSEKFGVTSHSIHHVPSLSGSLTMNREFDSGLNVDIQAQYVGSQKAPIDIRSDGHQAVDPFPDQGVSFYDPNNTVGSELLVHGAIIWDVFASGCQLSIRGTNLMDTQYTQGGSTLFPYPQPGRNWILDFTWKWAGN